MAMSEILIYAGAAGLVLAAIAIPVAIIVLHRQEKKILQSIHDEYEI